MHPRFLVPTPKSLAPRQGIHYLTEHSCFILPEEFQPEARRLTDAYWKISPVFSTSVPRTPREDASYAIEIDESSVRLDIASRDELLNAFKTLRQLAEPEPGCVTSLQKILPCITINDAPGLSFRGFHLCYFAETDEVDLEKMLRLAAYYKFNYIILEFWGTFPFERHPEFQWDEKHGNREYLRHLLELGRKLGVTLIPGYNLLGHASGASVNNGKHVVLDLHPEFAPLFEPDGWSWCLSNPNTHRMQQELIGEILDFFGDAPFFHVGFDEAFNAATCIECAQKDYPQMLLEHILFLHEELKKRNCQMMMWHDMFLELDPKKWGEHIILDRNRPNPAQILEKMPRDIVLCDWHYGNPVTPKTENDPVWPTSTYFASLGFPVLPSPLGNVEGILTMAEQAFKENYPGMLQTSWNLLTGTSTYRKLFFLPANIMWNSSWHPEKGFADELQVVNHHLRQMLHDMNVTDYPHFGTLDRMPMNGM